MDLISERGVTRQNAELTDRLTSMAKVRLVNLDALRGYRAAARTQISRNDISAVLFRSPTGRAISPEVYNPDYLRRVQTPRGLLPYFEGWARRFEDFQTVAVNADSHFDLLTGGDDLAELVDRIDVAIRKPNAGRRQAAPGKVVTESAPDCAIAVIGMSGRFPGADTLDDLFELLRGATSAITPLPTDRGWNVGDCPVRHGGFLQGMIFSTRSSSVFPPRKPNSSIRRNALF